MVSHSEVREGLLPLFEKAEKTGLWFYCRYQDIWLSPKELRDSQSRGQFLWGAVNWELRDPKERVESIKLRIKNAQNELVEFEKRIAG